MSTWVGPETITGLSDYVPVDEFFGAAWIDVDGTSSNLTLTTTHTWDRPGTYFATCLVHSHVDGDVNATSRRLPNLASARVVVS